MNDTPTSNPSSDAEEHPQDPAALVERYIKEIALYEKAFEKWEKDAEKIQKRYINQSQIITDAFDNNCRLNVLWSNVQTLQPAIYARTPKPVAERRYKDADPIGSLAAVLVERCLQFIVSNQNFDSNAKKVRDDRLLAGRGQGWVRYEPTMVSDPQGGERIGFQDVYFDYVHWRDFGHSTARSWDEVNLVWKKIYLTSDEVSKQFGADIAKKLDYRHTVKEIDKGSDLKDATKSFFKKAVVYEVWDKLTKNVVWIHKSYVEGPLGTEPDPLNLNGFFPCPEPLFATTTTDSLVPCSDYKYYKSLADQLDVVTRKQASLIDDLKVACLCDPSASEDLQKLFQSDHRQVIPIKQWIALKQQGGVNGCVEWLPLKPIVEGLQALQQAEDRIRAQIDYINGSPDIQRGVTDPNVPVGTQQMASNFLSIRLHDRQSDMQRFCRDIIAMMGEVVAEHFVPEQIAKMAGVDTMEQFAQQNWQAACELLKDDVTRNFKIDIETDSTIAVDDATDKAAVNEYITACGQFLSQAANMVQLMPELSPVAVEMLKFGMRRYRAGRNLENSLTGALDAVLERQKQEKENPPPPPPDPAQIKAQTDLQIAQMNQQDEQAKSQLKMQIEQTKSETKMALENMKAQTEMQKQQMQAQIEVQKQQLQMAYDNALAKAKLDMEGQIQAQQSQLQSARLQLDSVKAQQAAQLAQERLQMEAQSQERQLEIKRAQLVVDSVASGHSAQVQNAQTAIQHKSQMATHMKNMKECQICEQEQESEKEDSSKSEEKD